MPRFALIKDSLVTNVIVAEPDFITHLESTDDMNEGVLLDSSDFVNIGYSYINGEFIPYEETPPEEEPEEEASSSIIPRIVREDETFTIPDNSQISLSNEIVTESNGIILTEGTGSITRVN